MHSNTQLEFIIEAVPALIGYVDREERYRFNNHAYEQWFGHPVSEVAGRHLREVLGDEVYRAITPHVQAALSGRLVTFESSMLYRDGKTRYVRATYVPDVGEDGRVRGFVAHVNDITDLKRAEEEREQLRRNADELARVARALSESLDVAEVAERIAESVLPLFRAQSSVVRLLQPDGSLACVAIAGKWLENFKPGYLLPPGVGLVGRAVAERRALWTPDILSDPSVVLTAAFRRGLAGAGHHAVLAVPLQVKGEIIGVISTAHGEIRTFSQVEIDLLQAFADQAALAMRNVQLFTWEQTARAEAEAANRAKDQFLALLAHELRNPLAPIVTAAALIRRPGAPPDVVTQSADIVERQARNLARLLDDLLDVSRITRGRIELRRETVSLGDAVSRALEAARPLVDERGQAVSLAMPATPLYVDADATRLEQIVVNVLNNAAKYTPLEGRISVVASREGGDAVLRIRDTGMGIPAEMLPRIFDLFTQGDQSLAHTPGGLGIGLTLARRLVELHGGRVWAESDGPGRGSEFIIRLPLSRDLAAPAPATVAAPDRCPAAAVLLVEDNADARQTLRALLEHEGHRVDEAADGASGLASAEANRPDIVLIDIGLPGMDGYEVARRIRSRRGAEPILVAVSGYGQADDRRRSVEAGFDAHLTKPVSPDQLSGVLARLARRRERDEPTAPPASGPPPRPS
ncbi:MAG: ATP-binding protein [Candidatus Rokuibacteriota bacterium]